MLTFWGAGSPKRIRDRTQNGQPQKLAAWYNTPGATLQDITNDLAPHPFGRKPGADDRPNGKPAW